MRAELRSRIVPPTVPADERIAALARACNRVTVKASPKRHDLADFCGVCGHHERYHGRIGDPCTMCDCTERRPW